MWRGTGQLDGLHVVGRIEAHLPAVQPPAAPTLLILFTQLGELISGLEAELILLLAVVVIESPHTHSLGVLLEGVGTPVGLIAPKWVPAVVVGPLGGIRLAPVVAANAEKQRGDPA